MQCRVCRVRGPGFRIQETGQSSLVLRVRVRVHWAALGWVEPAHAKFAKDRVRAGAGAGTGAGAGAGTGRAGTHLPSPRLPGRQEAGAVTQVGLSRAALSSVRPSLPLRLQGDWSSKRYDLLLLVGRTHRTSHHCPRRRLPTVLCFKLLVSQHVDIPSLFSLTIHSLNIIAAAAMITTEPRPTRVFTRRQIEGLIAAGDTLVIADSHVLRLNAWQDLHPGGRLVIQHMVGRDATDELAMYVVHWRAAL